MQALVKKKQDRLVWLERSVQRLQRRIEKRKVLYRRVLLQQVLVLLGGILVSAFLCRLHPLVAIVGVFAVAGFFLFGWFTARKLRLSIERYHGLLHVY